MEERDNIEKKQGGKSTEDGWKRPENWKGQGCGKHQAHKRKVEMSEEALKSQKSQECCRRKEESGRMPREGQETRRKRRKILQKGCGMKKKEREWQREFQRKFKEFERRERSRKNGLEHHRTSEERDGTSQKRAEKDKKERIFWKKGHQSSINRACTYLEKRAS